MDLKLHSALALLLLLLLSSSNGRFDEANAETTGVNQQESLEKQQAAANGIASEAHTVKVSDRLIKCSRQSVTLARQMLANEFDTINNFIPIWFNDLDKDELLQEQKASLGNMIMSGSGSQLFMGDGQSLFEIESSYFRSLNQNTGPSSARSIGLNFSQTHPGASQQAPPMSLKLMRQRHQDKCYLHLERAQFTYTLGLAVGPIEHSLDVVYNLPRELRLSQPNDWKYAQIRLLAPRMQYEISLKQAADHNLGDPSTGCPIEISDVTYLGLAPAVSQINKQQPTQITVTAIGLAATNQTVLHLERLFNDYTRPTVSNRLRQVLKFYLNSKTLPLSS